MQDGIDWLNASTDFGLITLCREMDALARPIERVIATPKRPRRRSRIRAVRTVAA
jgi:hypothetical protein